MSHTFKDLPFKITGRRNHRYWCTPRGHASFTRYCRRAVRAKAKQAIRNGQEPEPKYRVQFLYWD